MAGIFDEDAIRWSFVRLAEGNEISFGYIDQTEPGNSSWHSVPIRTEAPIPSDAECAELLKKVRELEVDGAAFVRGRDQIWRLRRTSENP